MTSPLKAELNRRSRDSRKLYCGDQDILPRGYWNFGTRSQCTRKGVGIGMYVVPKQRSAEKTKRRVERRRIKSKLRNKKRRTDEDINMEMDMYEEDERERLEDLEDKNSYKDFLEEHFQEAREDARNLEIGDIFKRLSVLWKIQQSLAKKEYKNRRMERKGKE